MNNFEKYLGTPEKLALCITERNIEEEDTRGIEEPIRVITQNNGLPIVLGEFCGSWGFEDWLLSNMPFDKWKAEFKSD